MKKDIFLLVILFFLASINLSAQMPSREEWERLEKKPFETDQFPPEKTTFSKGDIAFRQHEGGHTVIPNWHYFIEFAERYFSGSNVNPVENSAF